MDLLAVLARLVECPGVSGSEERLAALVESELASAGYAAGQIERDYLGNRWLKLGPAGQVERLLVAHMDEIGLRVTAIRPDGICRVAAVGGIDPQLREATSGLVITRRGSVTGCVAPVSMPVTQRSNVGPTPRL